MTVNSTADPGGCNSTEYTLRKAITTSNGLPTTDTINFNIPDGPAPGRPGGLGIALNNDGVTANDNKDPDTGPNKLQNFPIITSASTTTVTGSLNSRPSKTFTIQFFSNPAPNFPTGFGEGETFLGEKTVTTNDRGRATFNFNTSVSAGQLVTATATDASGNTSEFSQALTVG